MDDKQLAFLRVTDPEKYKEYLQAQELKKKLAFPKLLSNMVGEEYVARMYEAFSGNVYVVEADGSHYQGKIDKKKYYVKTKNDVGRANGGYWAHYYQTDDGRYFNNTGWLCDKPKEDKAPVDEIIEQ